MKTTFMFHYRFSFLLYNGRLSLEFDSVRLFCVRVSVGVTLTLLVGMKTSTATTENNVEIP